MSDEIDAVTKVEAEDHEAEDHPVWDPGSLPIEARTALRSAFLRHTCSTDILAGFHRHGGFSMQDRGFTSAETSAINAILDIGGDGDAQALVSDDDRVSIDELDALDAEFERRGEELGEKQGWY